MPGLFTALRQEESAFGTLQVAAYTERANQMFQIAALLKQYALRYNLTVVTTNQVWLASQSCSWSSACCSSLPRPARLSDANEPGRTSCNGT